MEGPRVSFLPGRRAPFSTSNFPVYPTSNSSPVPQKYELGDLSLEYERMQEKEVLIVSRSVCSRETIGSLRVGLWQLDEPRLQTFLSSDGVYDPEAQYLTSCLADAILYSLEGNQGIQRLQRWIRSFSRIGEKSGGAYGEVYQIRGKRPGTLESHPGLFVLKKGLPKESTIHETVIGFLGLNPVRTLVPNFVYIYGFISCVGRDTQVINPGPSFSNWCSLYPESGKDPVTFVIQENITEAVTAYDFCRHCDASEFVVMYLQVMNALHIAHQECDFTHYDLHYQNVLIQRLNHNIAIPTRGATPQYLVGNLLARIIDFGFAHIRVQNQSFGVQVEKLGISWRRSFPMHDAYKFLCFCARRSRQNPEVFKEQERIWTFFTNALAEEGIENPELLRRVSRRQRDDYFIAPEALRNITHEQFLKFLREQYPYFFFTDPSPGVLAHCGAPGRNPCLTWHGYTTKFFNRTIRPSSIDDISATLEGLSLISSENFRTQVLTWLRQNTDLSVLVEQELPKYREVLEEAESQIDSFGTREERKSRMVGRLEDIQGMLQTVEYWDLEVKFILKQLSVTLDPKVQDKFQKIQEELLRLDQKILDST